MASIPTSRAPGTPPATNTARLDQPLPLTGERTAPGIAAENYWFRRHEAVYEWITRELVPAQIPALARPRPSTDGAILDAGCGEGYGAAMLAAATSGPVLGLELDQYAAKFAHARYGRATDAASGRRVNIVRSNLDTLPVSLGRVDLVVSLQVVEHLWALRRFLSECVRVLAPGGRCVISTPNRLTFSPGLSRGEKPTNPFHVEEFDAEQLTDLMIEAGMSNVSCLGLHHGQRLTTWERGNGPIVRALVEQAQSERVFDDWPRALRELVMSVETRDFTLSTSALESSIDLVAIGDAPLSEGSDRP